MPVMVIVVLVWAMLLVAVVVVVDSIPDAAPGEGDRESAENSQQRYASELSHREFLSLGYAARPQLTGRNFKKNFQLLLYYKDWATYWKPIISMKINLVLILCTKRIALIYMPF